MNAKRFRCPPHLDKDSGRVLFEEVSRATIESADSIVLDLSTTEGMDSLGGAWLMKISGLARKRAAEFAYEGDAGEVAEYMTLIGPGLASEAIAAPAPDPFDRMTDRAYAVIREIGEVKDLFVDTVYWTALAPFEGRGFRWGNFMDELYEMGVRAVRINCLMNFLLGLTIAMLSAAQVQPLGMGIFVADLIMIGFARELAPLMTAVVVSARTGAAITAELATMKVQEEIDALRGMGLNVSQFLVAPKLMALIVVMPCLVALGLVSGILGGAFWGVAVLGFRADAWYDETLIAATFSDLAQGLTKAFFFAIVIVFVGCHNGLRVTGGSRGVGIATTRAVVNDIFFLITIDMIFAAIFYFTL